MKNILWGVVAAMLVISCSSDSVEGNPTYLTEKQIQQEIENGVWMFFWYNDDGTVSVTYDHSNPMHVNINSGSSNDYYKGDIVIPSTITVDGRTMTVVGITESAFMNCTNLAKIVIPASVKTVGKMAFYNCLSLEEVTVQGSLTEIPDYCFSNCKTLKTLTVSGTVGTLGVEAFAKCSSLTSLKVPEGVTTINKNCFQNSGLTYAVLPTSTKELRPLAFGSCTKLKEIGIPDAITALEDSVFYGCSSLLTAYLPETLVRIGIGTFAGCRSIIEMDIPASVKQIGEKCFFSESAEGVSNSKTLVLNVKATVPPVLTGSITNATSYSRVVVPKGCRNAYLAAPYWSEFTQVMERNY